ncbi:hypothetical protein B4Q04_07535 [Zobellia sp. OII3]|nr:hypothetical protein B4Q04_07535 [Zobellia sp. OII3]
MPFLLFGLNDKDEIYAVISSKTLSFSSFEFRVLGLLQKAWIPLKIQEAILPIGKDRQMILGK